MSTLYEPFAGSAAVTLAAAANHMAERHVISDSLEPLVNIWKQIIAAPTDLADDYERIWSEQEHDPVAHFLRVRAEFNKAPLPAPLLYLLARCVKNAVRFNSCGEFNQSADHRRRGMNPAKMRKQLLEASALLRDKASAVCADYTEVVESATSSDLVYMDPPYQGVSGSSDPRYHQQLNLKKFVKTLEQLNDRNVPFIISFDGQCGTKEYGEELPAELSLKRVLVHTGRSSQATLVGRDDETVESIYVSRQLAPNAKKLLVSLSPEKEPLEQLQLALP